MTRALVVYATSSGSTRAVAEACAAMLSRSTVLLDLRSLASAETPLPSGRFDVVVAGTPTYGTGEWHTAWSAHVSKVAPLMCAAGTVMLFGLGDARGHGRTFAGGLGVLADHVAALGIAWTGGISPSRYHFDASPALRNGAFPGLVVEYRRNRQVALANLRDWLHAFAPQPLAAREAGGDHTAGNSTFRPPLQSPAEDTPWRQRR